MPFVQIFLSEAFVTTLLQEAADLVATAEKCMPGSRRTDPEGNMDVHAFFDEVHRHPALAILQQMDPAGYGKVHESLKAIEADLQHIVQKAKAQAWNNATSLEDILQDFKGMINLHCRPGYNDDVTWAVYTWLMGCSCAMHNVSNGTIRNIYQSAF